MSGQQYQQRRDTRANIEAATPAPGEAFFVTDKNEGGFGDGATAGGQLHQRKNQSESLAPAQITSDQNNYAPASYTRHTGALVLSTDAKRRVTGLTGGSTDRVIFIVNGGSQQLILSDADAASTAANRFDLGGDLVLLPKGGIKLFYNATASRWQRTSGGGKVSTIPEEFLLSGVISPTQLAANTNDYAPTGITLASTLRLSTDASRNLTGIADPRDGAIKWINNIGTNPLVLQNENVGSSAANRFSFGADITLSAKQAALVRYDATDSRWKLMAQTAGSGVAAGGVTAQTLSASAMAFVGMINGTLVPSVGSSALTIALKTLAGSDPSAADPTFVIFRSGTAATGDYTVLTVTAATSLVISSGSSMGVAANNTAFRLWVVGFNDAGTFRLGAINCLSGSTIYPLSGWGNASSTAEGGAGAADAAQTFYTGTAVSSRSYAVLGYMSWEAGLAAAGTWAAGPTRTQLFGAGVPLPGQQVDIYRTVTGAVATGTGVIPLDDTVPQFNEGDQYLQVVFTPSSAANLLDAEAKLNLTNSASSWNMIASLFQDSTTNSLASSVATYGTGFFALMFLRYIGLAGVNIQTALKVRAGGSAAGTTTFNGSGGSRFLGASLDSHLTIREIMA